MSPPIAADSFHRFRPRRGPPDLWLFGVPFRRQGGDGLCQLGDSKHVSVVPHVDGICDKTAKSLLTLAESLDGLFPTHFRIVNVNYMEINRKIPLPAGAGT